MKKIKHKKLKQILIEIYMYIIRKYLLHDFFHYALLSKGISKHY